MVKNSYAILEERGVLAVGGPDRKAFLQGLVSNDVLKAGPDRAVHAALLTPQGKYLHDFFILEWEDILLLDCEAARVEDLLRRLRMYKLRSKVTLEDRTDETAVAVLFGDGVHQALGLPAEAGGARALDTGVAYVDPRLLDLGARAILPRDRAVDILDAMGLAHVDAGAYKVMRLRHGVPDGSHDLVIDKSILLEANFDVLNGISWDKGCYMGQELTARTHYRGLIKKRMLPVLIEGPLPRPGMPVMRGDKEAGEIRSVAADGQGGHALALLRLEEVEAATGAGEPLTAGPARITPVKPDWFPG